MTIPMWFSLAGLVCLVCTLVMGEMFERAIEEHVESHDSYDPARERLERDELR